MIMKVHKIRGIDRAVCCAEQKIAYNIAWRLALRYRDSYKKQIAENPPRLAIHEYFAEMLHAGMKEWSYNKDYNKYNTDAIQTALRNGIEKYFNNYFIASDYECIGKCFEIPYEIV